MKSAHVAAGLARQARLGEQAHVQRRHAHEHGGLGQPGNDRLRVELREPDHRAAVEQRAVRGDEQAVHMEDRQRVDQHVARLPAPVVLQRERVGKQVAVAQHRALAAPRGARGVEDRGQVVGRAPRWLVAVAVQRGALQQRAAAIVVEREHVRRAGLERDLRHPAETASGAHHHRRLGVADEVLDLGRLVGGVERQVDEPRAQHRQVQHQRLDRLLGLRRDAAAGGQLERSQQVGDHRRAAVEVAPGVAPRRRRRRRSRSHPAPAGSQCAARRRGCRSMSWQFERVVNRAGSAAVVSRERRQCPRGVRRCRHSRSGRGARPRSARRRRSGARCAC